MLLPHDCSYVWLVLLPKWLIESPPMGVVPDVTAKVPDGIATGSMFQFQF